MTTPTGIEAEVCADCYNVTIGGVKADPYRILEAYQIMHPAHQHALKKLLRAGRSHKTLDEDIAETIQSLVRWQEMRLEDLQEILTEHALTQ